MTTRALFTTGLFVLVLLLLAACGGPAGDSPERGGWTVSIEMGGVNVAADSEVPLKAVADEGLVGDVRVEWSAVQGDEPVGEFSDADQLETTWTAPASPGVVTLSVHVEHQGRQGTASEAVTVAAGKDEAPDGSKDEDDEDGAGTSVLEPVIHAEELITGALGQISLSIEVNDEWEDHSSLGVSWLASGGSFTKNDSLSTEWLAPETPGTYEVLARVQVAAGDEALEETAVISLLVNECDAGNPADRDDPCVITTLAQLQHLPLAYLDGHFKLGADIDASETKTWNEGTGFEPIGRPIISDYLEMLPGDDRAFTGVFDGNGKTVSGLYINRPHEAFLGLFGKIMEPEGDDSLESSPRVFNLRLKNVEIIGNAEIGSLVGHLAAHVSGVSVDNAEIEAAGSENRYVGGLVGRAVSATIQDSSVRDVLMSVRDGHFVGGHTGYIIDSTVIEDSPAEGIELHATGSYMIGGHTGASAHDSSIHRSSVENVLLVTSDTNTIGGHTGYPLDLHIEDSPATNIKINAEDAWYVGGYIGIAPDVGNNPSTNRRRARINASPVQEVQIDAVDSLFVGGYAGQAASINISQSAVNGIEITVVDSKHIGGFAGDVQCAEVTEAPVEAVTITASDSSGIGGHSGTVLESTVQDSSVTTIVLAVEGDDTLYVGGHSAYVEASTIKRSAANDISINIAGAYYVGGHTGTERRESRIEDSPVTGIDLTAVDGNFIGGHSGYAHESTIINSTAADIYVEAENGFDVGGHTGNLNDSALENSAAENVVLEVDNTKYVGGLIGISHPGTKVENSPVSSVDITATASEVIGGYVGRITDTEMRNSMAEEISIAINGHGEWIGGHTGNAVTSSIEQSGVENINITIDQGYQIGGHTGRASEADISHSTAKEVTLDVSSEGEWIGGHTGVAVDSVIRDSTAMDIDLTTENSFQVGGHTGRVSASTMSRSNAVDVVMNTQNGRWIGGHTGQSHLGSSVSASKAENVSLTAHNATEVGGHTGMNRGMLCQAAALNVYVDAPSSFNVGGLVGMNGNGIISESFTAGGSEVNGYSEVGGLVGYDWEGSVWEAYSIQTLVTGLDSVGGLIGTIANHASRVENTYTTSKIEGDTHVGALIGRMEESSNLTVTDSFWSAEFASASAGGTQVSTPDLTFESTFTGWMFNTTWQLFPVLGGGTGPKDKDYGTPDLINNSRH